MTPRRLNAGIIAVASLVLGIYYAGHAPAGTYVGAGWFDQSQYLKAVHAWAAGDLDPAHHWYLPGYAMLGAAFLWLTPAQPFWLPDLLCLLLSLWLLSAIAARLFPSWRWASAAGALAFLATTAFWPQALRPWVIPWTTTPTVPLTYAAVLMALRFRDAPCPKTAFFAAFAASGIALFRPTEAMVAYATIPGFMAWWLVAARPRLLDCSRAAGAALTGAILPIAVLAAAHSAIYGLSPGQYIAQSAAIGFEWRLIPLRWVMLVLGPQPALSTHLQGGGAGGMGLAAMFPWIIPGLAGIAACLLAPGTGCRAGHAMVVAIMAAQVMAYLAYRDLHAEGLWRFDNVHYFKGTLPVFGLYALVFLCRLTQGHQRLATLAAALSVVPLLCWRVGMRPVIDGSVAISGPHEMALGHGLAPIGMAIAVPAAGEWDSTYFGANDLAAGGTVYARGNEGLKAFPVPGGFILVPLRSLPQVASVLRTGPGLVLDPSIPPVVLSQVIRFGFPCIVPRFDPSCTVPQPLPAPSLPLGQTLPFGGLEERYLMDGWAVADASGRWTNAPRAGLFIRPADLGPDAVAITLSIDADIDLPQPGAITLGLRAGNVQLAEWRLGGGGGQGLRSRIPLSLLNSTGSLSLEVTTDERTAPGRRHRGLHVRAIRLDAE